MTRAQAVAATSPMPLISTEPKPFDVYEVIDAETPERAAAKLATRPLLDSAMNRYFAREFEAALALFGQPMILRTSSLLFSPSVVSVPRGSAPADWQDFEKLTSK